MFILLMLKVILRKDLTRISAFSATVVFMNSSINPFLYCWRLSELRTAVVKTARKMFCAQEKQEYKTDRFMSLNFLMSLIFFLKFIRSPTRNAKDDFTRTLKRSHKIPECLNFLKIFGRPCSCFNMQYYMLIRRVSGYFSHE